MNTVSYITQGRVQNIGHLGHLVAYFAMLAVMPCDMLFVLLTVVIWIPFSIDRMEFYLTWVTCDICVS
jgi:hypothetical protein